MAWRLMPSISATGRPKTAVPKKWPKLLEHQAEAGRRQLGQRAAHQQAELGDEEQQRRLQDGRRALKGHCDGQPGRQAGTRQPPGRAQQQRPQQRQQHHLGRASGRLNIADEFRGQDEQEGCGEQARVSGASMAAGREAGPSKVVIMGISCPVSCCGCRWGMGIGGPSSGAMPGA